MKILFAAAVLFLSGAVMAEPPEPPRAAKPEKPAKAAKTASPVAPPAAPPAAPVERLTDDERHSMDLKFQMKKTAEAEYLNAILAVRLAHLLTDADKWNGDGVIIRAPAPTPVAKK